LPMYAALTTPIAKIAQTARQSVRVVSDTIGSRRP
jgi:hypothetical protein